MTPYSQTLKFRRSLMLLICYTPFPWFRIFMTLSPAKLDLWRIAAGHYFRHIWALLSSHASFHTWFDSHASYLLAFPFEGSIYYRRRRRPHNFALLYFIHPHSKQYISHYIGSAYIDFLSDFDIYLVAAWAFTIIISAALCPIKQFLLPRPRGALAPLHFHALSSYSWLHSPILIHSQSVT